MTSTGSLRDLLAGYDREVEHDIAQVRAAETGTERIQLAHKLRRAIAVHDSVLNAVLCPVLDDLPDGAPVAAALRKGCHERSQLLVEFKLTFRMCGVAFPSPITGRPMPGRREGRARAAAAW